MSVQELQGASELAAQWATGPKAKTKEYPRAWVVVCKGLGLINMIAESAEELVGRVHQARDEVGLAGPERLVAFPVVDNTEAGDEAVIWFDPALVQAVLNEYVRPPIMSRGPARAQRAKGDKIELPNVAVVQVGDGGAGGDDE